MRFSIIVLLALTFSPYSFAETYRCVVDGRTAFQDYPCNGGPDLRAPSRAPQESRSVSTGRSYPDGRNYKVELEAHYSDLNAFEKQATLCNSYAYYRNQREAYNECNKATNMGNEGRLQQVYVLARSIMNNPARHPTETQWTAAKVIEKFDTARDLIRKGLNQLKKR